MSDTKRLGSIDLLRGIIMVIMALDHVRDYFHRDAYIFDPTDLSHTNPALFFTRWITHFCAPIFMFLAGISATLYGAKNGRKALSFFLLTRGCWLIFAELSIVSIGWTFNLHF
ncbi:MAG TPA: heparan-alpha-glucosaminide N-acetyltransferase domain-containing protein, partial [Puia sp.]|nr:heparan-alpha-glucosaminide N-acetyltransferase domain-containing protein [Puia sp.]